MGQVNRVDAARLAIERAGERAAGSVAASDAFFPFPDGPQLLLDAGIRAIVQPGGSVRDAEVVAAAEAAGRVAVPDGHPPLRPLSTASATGPPEPSAPARSVEIGGPRGGVVHESADCPQAVRCGQPLARELSASAL